MKVEIKDLTKMLEGSFSNKTSLKGYKTKALVEPGQNYGSLILGLTVELEDFLSQTLEYNFVAKMLPKSEFIKEHFNVQVTFKRELDMYRVVVPTLVDFQVEQGSPNAGLPVPKCYAARINLNPESAIVDDDAVILLENISHLGFTTLNRIDGFSLNATKIALKALATFHATPVALKMLKPDLFKQEVLPYLTSEEFLKMSDKLKADITNNLLGLVKSSDQCSHLLVNVTNTFKKFDEYQTYKPPPLEPYATIIHNDFWLNNIMMKSSENDPEECMIIDFQMVEYGSPCQDLVFFLYTSVNKDVLHNNFNQLVDYYYEEFLNALSVLKCETTIFNYTTFTREVKKAAQIQLKYILYRLSLILRKKSTVALESVTEKDLVRPELESDEFRKRLVEVILDYFDKGWI